MNISVVMCSYNGEKFIEEQLVSILSQDKLPYEIIICDDQSTDGTVAIIEKIRMQNHTVPINLFINKTRKGYTKNFEEALKKAKGDILALSDQDDYWEPNKLSAIAERFEKNKNLELIFTNAHIVDAKLQHKGYSLFESVGLGIYKKNKLKKGNYFEELLKYNFVTGATMAFRKEILKQALPIPETWVHDAWISLVVSINSYIEFIDVPLIKYRQHSNNQIGSTNDFIEKTKRNLRRGNTNNLGYNQFLYFKTMVDNRKIEINKAYYRLLEYKVKHFYNRKNINSNIFKSLIIIANELLTFRYFKYSQGIRSAAKDLYLMKNQNKGDYSK